MSVFDVSYEPVGIDGDPQCLMAMRSLKNVVPIKDKVYNYGDIDMPWYEMEVEADTIKQALDEGYALIMKAIEEKEDIRFVPPEDSWKPIKVKVTHVEPLPLNIGDVK